MTLPVGFLLAGASAGGAGHMPNSDHFYRRSAVYRELAIDSQNDWSAECLFDIADLFHRIARDMAERELALAQTPDRCHRLFDAFSISSL